MDIQIGAQVKIINPDDTAEYGIEVGDEGVVVWIGEYASYGVCIPKKSDVYAYALNDLEIIKPFQVPEGFVLVSQKDLLELTIAINAVDLATHTESKTNEVREMWQQVALKLMALGISQEPAND